MIPENDSKSQFFVNSKSPSIAPPAAYFAPEGKPLPPPGVSRRGPDGQVYSSDGQVMKFGPDGQLYSEDGRAVNMTQSQGKGSFGSDGRPLPPGVSRGPDGSIYSSTGEKMVFGVDGKMYSGNGRALVAPSEAGKGSYTSGPGGIGGRGQNDALSKGGKGATLSNGTNEEGKIIMRSESEAERAKRLAEAERIAMQNRAAMNYFVVYRTHLPDVGTL